MKISVDLEASPGNISKYTRYQPTFEQARQLQEACMLFAERSEPLAGHVEVVRGSFRNQEVWHNRDRSWLVSAMKVIFHCPISGEKLELAFDNWHDDGLPGSPTVLDLSSSQFAGSLIRLVRSELLARAKQFAQKCESCIARANEITQ